MEYGKITLYKCNKNDRNGIKYLSETLKIKMLYPRWKTKRARVMEDDEVVQIT